MGVNRSRRGPGYHRQQVISRIDSRSTLLRSAVDTAFSGFLDAPIVHAGQALAIGPGREVVTAEPGSKAAIAEPGNEAVIAGKRWARMSFLSDQCLPAVAAGLCNAGCLTAQEAWRPAAAAEKPRSLNGADSRPGLFCCRCLIAYWRFKKERPVGIAFPRSLRRSQAG